MSRLTVASLALLIVLTPAGVAIAADAQPAAAAARALTPAEEKSLTARLIVLTSEIDDLQQQYRVALRPAYRSPGHAELREVPEALASAYNGLPSTYTVIPTGYKSALITSTNGLAGYAGASSSSIRPKTPRLLRLERQIATLAREHELLTARLAEHRAG